MYSLVCRITAVYMHNSPDTKGSHSIRTDQTIRLQTSSNAPALIPCPTCHLSFACSTSHWTLAQSIHSSTLSPDLPESLTQCQINTTINIDEQFSSIRAEAGSFQWAPNRTVSRWSPLLSQDQEKSDSGSRDHVDRTGNWLSEFGGLFAKELGMSEATERSVGVWVRAASEGLSVPMTIMWGLELLHQGDESWTRKKELEIHVRMLTSPQPCREYITVSCSR